MQTLGSEYVPSILFKLKSDNHVASNLTGQRLRFFKTEMADLFAYYLEFRCINLTTIIRKMKRKV
jgi:hypothetical protein